MSEQGLFPGLPERLSRLEWRHDVMDVAALSDRGLVRAKNEDSFYVVDPDVSDLARGVMIAVADGMGGHVAGEVASQTAVDHISTFYHDQVGEPPFTHLARKVIQANENLVALAQESPVLRGMGTTLTAGLIVDAARLLVCHVGDSRLYLMRDGRLEQRSNDHSFVSEQVRLGFLTEQEARVHPARNIITRAIGIREVVEPDLASVDLKPGDRILLCSDGLHGYVEDEPIRAKLAEAPCVAEACAQLVCLAIQAGAPDNVTVVVAFIKDTDRMLARLKEVPPQVVRALPDDAVPAAANAPTVC